ncbi:hypothetical protein EON66_05705 [archaeon]|nr:MAG: hypothetical protein EON66_05705 [archaeon]
MTYCKCAHASAAAALYATRYAFTRPDMVCLAKRASASARRHEDVPQSAAVCWVGGGSNKGAGVHAGHTVWDRRRRRVRDLARHDIKRWQRPRTQALSVLRWVSALAVHPHACMRCRHGGRVCAASHQVGIITPIVTAHKTGPNAYTQKYKSGEYGV